MKNDLDFKIGHSEGETRRISWNSLIKEKAMRFFAPLRMTRRKIAFSLVELMISLIVISIVVAAFAPVVTKKLKTSDQSIGSASVDYIYDEEICSKKVSNCAMCLDSTCIRCKNNYYLKNNKCFECSDGCINCDITQGCTRCEKGYYLKDGTCTTCPAGCSKCENETSCSECKDGYYISGNQCIECDSNCISCSTTKGCLKCIDKYKVQNKRCGEVSCPDGQYVSGDSCKRCSIGGHMTCSDVNVFTGCTGGWLFSKNSTFCGSGAKDVVLGPHDVLPIA